MRPPGSPFAGSDPEYLRNTQYATSAKLADRGRLHALYSVATESVFEHLARHTRGPRLGTFSKWVPDQGGGGTTERNTSKLTP